MKNVNCFKEAHEVFQIKENLSVLFINTFFMFEIGNKRSTETGRGRKTKTRRREKTKTIKRRSGT